LRFHHQARCPNESDLEKSLTWWVPLFSPWTDLLTLL
jgi:hypothetical protein